MIYLIYHPIGGSMNHFCEPHKYEYTHVLSLEADNIEEAFKLGQNDFNEKYAKLGNRSTSVGDIIQSQEDFQQGICHLIKEIGFEKVSEAWLSFIDWSNQMLSTENEPEENIPEPWDHPTMGC
jgi:hypothetical protein